MNDRSFAALGAPDLFKERWALVTAGTMDDHNACTIGWGSLGTLWGRRTVTVYVYPSRRTFDYLRARDTFTVSFFPPAFKKALGVMGTLSDLKSVLS